MGLGSSSTIASRTSCCSAVHRPASSAVGRLERARSFFETLAERGVSTIPRDSSWLFTQALLSEVCRALGPTLSRSAAVRFASAVSRTRRQAENPPSTARSLTTWRLGDATLRAGRGCRPLRGSAGDAPPNGRASLARNHPARLRALAPNPRSGGRSRPSPRARRQRARHLARARHAGPCRGGSGAAAGGPWRDPPPATPTQLSALIPPPLSAQVLRRNDARRSQAPLKLRIPSCCRLQPIDPTRLAWLNRASSRECLPKDSTEQSSADAKRRSTQRPRKGAGAGTLGNRLWGCAVDHPTAHQGLSFRACVVGGEPSGRWFCLWARVRLPQIEWRDHIHREG